MERLTQGQELPPPVEPYEKTGFFENLSEGNIKGSFPSIRANPRTGCSSKKAAYTEAYQNAMSLPGMTAPEASKVGLAAMEKVTASSMGPSLLEAYGPAGVATGAGLYAAGLTFLKSRKEKKWSRAHNC